MELDRLNAVALMTGAATGNGPALAGALAPRCEGGLILIDRAAEALDAAADALTRPPERVSTLAFDTADSDRWGQAEGFIRNQYGRVDWAVLNAAPPAPASTDLVDWRRDAGADLDAVFLSLRALMSLMGENSQGGAIVVIAPAASLLGGANGGAYAAAKAGLLQLTRAAAREGAGKIRINAIAPAGAGAPLWDETPWFHDLLAAHGDARAAFDAIMKMPAPVARHAAGADISALIKTLLSDACPLTGATLMLDGGYAI